MLYAASPLVPWPDMPLGVMEGPSKESTKSEGRDTLAHNGRLCNTDIYALWKLILAFLYIC